MSSYCVIGSGISGATIANLLSKKNSVHIYDKARGPGGRSSFKRLNSQKDLTTGHNIFLQNQFNLKNLLQIYVKKKS